MTVVVKIGGAKAVEPAGAVADIADLVAEGEPVVVIHGGSTAVDDLLDRLGIEPTYVETPDGVVGRFTDEATMEAFTMAMGRVNTDLVAAFREAGVDAVGLSGVDGGLITGPRKSAVRVVEDGKKKIKRGDHSGKIESVNDELLATLLGDGYTPVAGPPMLADDGVAVNTDADRAAADPDDPETLIESVTTPAEYDALTDAAEGFMTKKVMAATEALESGASEVIVADANADAPVTAALGESGTHIHRNALEDP
jgi:acetylglutamate/LysW-gamma-L-alpha-aminoadipate kinase